VQEGTKIADVIKRVMSQAEEKAGGADALLKKLKAMGIRSPRHKDGDYSRSIVSKWAGGGVMPGADVLLAAALVGEFDVEEALRGPGSLPAQVAELRDQMRWVAEQLETWTPPKGGPRGRPTKQRSA
jgi:hypothetical protein